MHQLIDVSSLVVSCKESAVSISTSFEQLHNCETLVQ